MSLYQKIIEKKEKVSVIGLGYVGMPIAVSFADYVNVIGFDMNRKKIQQYQQGIDPTNEVGNERIEKTSVNFTDEESKLREAKFHIVAVPTPIREDKTPDLEPVKSASEILSRNLTKGSIVVYESTVYPGVTEDICKPILEQGSGLCCGQDFKIGYSPERINPGDKEHRLENIVKIVSGMDEKTLQEISMVYEIVVKAGVHKAESIKIAEAAKVIENSQRDINIAFMNELSIIFHKMGIDTRAVLRAAKTKWNFLDFSPGLVGGHCIGVDPYYLTYKAEQAGYHSQVILAGRRINDNMGIEVIRELIRIMVLENLKIKSAKVVILGFTFKENCPDIRNTRVIDMVKELGNYGITPVVVDPIAEKGDAVREYGIEICDSFEKIKKVDAIIFAVAHDVFKSLSLDRINEFFQDNKERHKIVFDLKGMFNKKDFKEDYFYWSL